MPEKTVLGTFFGFFLGQNFFSRPLFLIFFSGSLKFSRALFRIFSRVDFFFLGQKFQNFLGHIFFSRAEFFQRAFNFLLVKSLVCKIQTGGELLLSAKYCIYATGKYHG